jgi:hypothetical protein
VGKGGTAAGAAIDERLGTALVIEMNPPHHRLRVAVRARRHLRGAVRLRDLVERQKALAGARMRRAGRQPPQILRRLTPPRGVDTQHAGSELEAVVHPIQMGEPGSKNYISQTGRGLALALQLHILFPMNSLHGGLMGASPERPGDDLGRLDAALRQAHGYAADFLDRPADEGRVRAIRRSVFGGGVWFA